jgi:hypothetical protein
MISGFALAAAPAEYRVKDVQTFIISHDGIVGDEAIRSKRCSNGYSPIEAASFRNQMLYQVELRAPKRACDLRRNSKASTVG